MPQPPHATPAPEHLVLFPNPARAGGGVVAEWRPVAGIKWYRISRDGAEVWSGSATKCHLPAVAGLHTVSAQNSHGYGPESTAVVLRTHASSGSAAGRSDDEWSALLRELYRFAEGAILGFAWDTPLGDPRWKSAAEYVCEAVEGLFGAAPTLRFDATTDDLGTLLRIAIAGNVQAHWELLERPRVAEREAGAFLEKVFRVLDPSPFDSGVLRSYLDGRRSEEIAAELGVELAEVEASLRSLTQKLEDHFGPELRSFFGGRDVH